MNGFKIHLFYSLPPLFLNLYGCRHIVMVVIYRHDHVCIQMHAYIHGKQKLTLGGLPQWLSDIFPSFVCLVCNNDISHRSWSSSVWLVNETQRNIHPHQLWDYKRGPLCSSFFHGFWGTNVCSLSCRVNTLLPELSSQSHFVHNYVHGFSRRTLASL